MNPRFYLHSRDTLVLKTQPTKKRAKVYTDHSDCSFHNMKNNNLT